jgi:hypothetical protein
MKYVASTLHTTPEHGVSSIRLCLKCDGTRTETRFRLSMKRTSLFKSARGVSSVDYCQASCTHQPVGFVLLVQACVLHSCDAYWLPTPVSCFPFTSPPVRHRVPSRLNWSLQPLRRPRRLQMVDRTAAPRRFKWTRPFHRKTKSGFCACAITFQLAYTLCCFRLHI